MRRFHRFALFLMIAGLLAGVAPVLPAHAALPAAPVRQTDEQAIVNRIADIRDQAPTIQEEFTRDEENWELNYDEDGSVYYRSGQLHIAVEADNTLLWTKSTYSATDFYLELDVRHQEGSIDNQFGVIFHFIDGDNYYLYSISSDGYYSLYQLVDNEWEPVVDWQESDLIESGERSSNTMGLLVEGEDVILLVNDYILDQATLPTTDGDVLALAAGAFDEPPVDMGFSELRVWDLGAPVPEPTPTRIRVPRRTPTAEVTPGPTEEPTEEPTLEPTPEPTEEPTPEPGVLGYDKSIPVDDPDIAAIQAETPTYVEEFDQEVLDWSPSVSEGIREEVLDGALQFDVDVPSTLGWSGMPSYPTQYYLEVDVEVGDPIVEAEYGILFNYQSAQNFDFFAVDTAGRYSLWRLNNNAWEETIAWTEGPMLNAGPDSGNRIGLLVDGDAITLVGNGEVMESYTDPDPLEGGLALAVGTFAEGGMQVRFDNVALWDLAPSHQAEVITPTPAPPVIDEEAAAAAMARIEEIQATEPTLSDDFRRDTGAWDTEGDEYVVFAFERRALHIDVTGPSRSAWTTYEAAPDEPAQIADFYIEFDTSFVTHNGDNGAGLVFRMGDGDNYYLLSVAENGYVNLIKRVDGEWTDLTPWTFSEAVDTDPDAVNRIGILVEGTSIAVTVNGEVVTTAEDDTFSSGSLGLLGQAFSAESAEISMDNVLLWTLDAE